MAASEATTSPTPSCMAGQKLAELRMAQNISLSDMAGRLKLSEQRISDIETGQFAEQTLDIFDRGHIYNYCRVMTHKPKDLVEEVFDLLEAEGFVVRDDDYVVKPKKLSTHPTFPKMGMMVTRTKVIAVLLVVAGVVFAGLIGHLIGSRADDKGDVIAVSGDAVVAESAEKPVTHHKSSAEKNSFTVESE